MQNALQYIAQLLAFGLVLALPIAAHADEARVSSLGQYSGYSQPLYQEWVRSSQYIAMRDGTRLAIDLLRPAVNGKAVTTPLPVVLAATRYQRAIEAEGKIRSYADIYPHEVQKLLRHGYVVAAVDLRGTGASFGSRGSENGPEHYPDLYDTIEWLAAQPWSTDKVGMTGCSYVGTTQFMAAMAAPPSLKAIFPAMAPFEWYQLTFSEGVPRSFLKVWSERSIMLDTQPPAPPVDGDSDGRLKAAAVAQHQKNVNVWDMMSSMPYRDSVFYATGKPYFLQASPGLNLHKFKPGLAIYHWGGMNDPMRTEQLKYLANLDNPQKITLGPWYHCAGSDMWATEELRWFDYWLKDIDNGIMDEAPINYYTAGAAQDQQWRSAQTWPLPQTRQVPLYFAGGPSGSVASVNDGVLSAAQPAGEQGEDQYRVDYTTSLRGLPSQRQPMKSLLEGANTPDFGHFDRKGLTYTSPPLAADMEMSGSAVVHLWLASSADDGDFFVYLHEVDANGSAYNITDGILRASRRALATPPYNNLGLPFHSNFQADAKPLLPGEPARLDIDLLADSHVFRRGSRIRLTITAADQVNFVTPELTPPPTVTLFRNTVHASYLELPVIGAGPEFQ